MDKKDNTDKSKNLEFVARSMSAFRFTGFKVNQSKLTYHVTAALASGKP
jgi:hypothetical protein